MNIRTTLSALVFAAAAAHAAPAAAAACTGSFALGSMGPPAIRLIGNDFYSPTHFDDCYSFTLSNPAEAFGLALEWDLSWRNDIDVTSVALAGGSLPASVVDTTPEGFSFDNLLAGTYQLIISGDVSGGSSYLPVGYFGKLVTTRDSVARVPEPQTSALLALGLGIGGWIVRRRRSDADRGS